MSGEKINDYGIGDVNATSIMETLDAQRIGYHSLTITEFDTTTKPAIAAGSKVEVNGGLYKFDSEEAISGTPADGTVYILLKPSGDTITAEFTATAPTWSDSKQGWYGTGGSENYRYANYRMTKSGVNYSDKAFLLLNKTTDFIVAENGDITCNDITCNNISGVDAVLSGTLDIAGMISESLASSGYIDIGGLTIQWGSFSGSVPVSVTFPKAFTQLYSVVATQNYTTNTSVIYFSGVSVSGCTIHVSTGVGTASGYYIAVGAS